MTAPTRRALLGNAVAGLAGAGLRAGGAVTMPATDQTVVVDDVADRRLIEIWREMADLRRVQAPLNDRWFAMCRMAAGPAKEAEFAFLVRHLVPISTRCIDEAENLPALSFQGAIAKAQVALWSFEVAHWTVAGFDFGRMDGDERFLWHLCRDLVAMAPV